MDNNQDIDADILNQLVDELKELYTTFRRSLIGNAKFNVPQHDKLDESWKKLACDIVNTGADPYDWIAACFEAYKPYPFVNQLHGTVAQALYQQYSTNLYANTKKALEVQSFNYTTYTNLNKSPEEILKDKLLPLSAIFRFMLAVELNLTDVQKLFKYDAKLQYLINRTYSTILKELDENLWLRVEELLTKKS